MCESPLHGPRGYVDRVWGRSASCMFLNIRVFLDFKNVIGFCVGKGIVNMKTQEASCEYDSKEKKLKAKKAATEQRYCPAVCFKFNVFKFNVFTFLEKVQLLHARG